MNFYLLLNIRVKTLVNISVKTLSTTYGQKILDHAKRSAKMHIKLLQKESFKKTVEATSDLIGNEIANKITRFPKNSQQNISDRYKLAW